MTASTTDAAPDVDTVPFAIEVIDRIPKERYFDAGFHRLEAERLWPRVWQMACRLEEIPRPHDCVEYRVLDQTVIVVRTEDGGARAFHNACRHRGVRLVEGSGNCEAGFTCPFHGWCYGPDGHNTFVSRPKTFSEHNLQPGDIDLTAVRCETWGGLAWINLDDDAPPLRECIEPFATVMEGWKLASMRAEWWRAFHLPVNWKLAEEAFMEQYHVLETHPQLRLPGRYAPRNGSFDPAVFRDAELTYLRTMNVGMSGMVHATDVALAEGLDVDLPVDAAEARATWERTLNDAVVAWHRERGADMPDLNGLVDRGVNEPMAYCFPNVFVLPMYSSASAYRFRPLGPEETLMEIWSLVRRHDDDPDAGPEPPEVWAHDDPRVPPIPSQDFSNLPRQQAGLHARGFEYMRLSGQIEGHLSNWHRLIDGYLGGLPTSVLVAALPHVNVNPLDRAIVDIGIGESPSVMDAPADTGP